MERKGTYQFIVAIGALFTVLAATDARADGRFIITPHVEVSVEHESNFFRTEKDSVSANVLNISPGVQVIYKTAKTKLTVDGTLERHDYNGGTSPDFGSISDYSYTGGQASLDLTSQITNRLTVGLKDGLRVTRDPQYIDDYSNSVGREKYTTNAVTPNLYYDFGNKFGIGARYQNSLITYNEGDGEDYTENRGAIDLFYNFNRSTALYLDYQIWKGEYSGSSSDYLSNEVSLNISKQLNYFTFTAGAGYYTRQFDDSGYSNINGITWKVMLDGKDRRDEDDDTKKPRSFLSLGLIHDLNNYGAGDSYYAATRLQLKGGYNFGPKLSVQGMALYQYSDYQLNPSNRADNLYILSGEVDYEVVENLTAGIEAGYRNQDSDAAGQSYDDVFMMFKVSYSYNFGHK